MKPTETNQRDYEFEVALCRAEISKLETEISELNASLAAAHQIILGGGIGEIHPHENSNLVAKLSARTRLFFRLGSWLKGTKAKSIFFSLPSSIQAPVYSIARKIGLV
jgi:hypothetical protein